MKTGRVWQVAEVARKPARNVSGKMLQ